MDADIVRYKKRPVVVETMRWDGTAEGATQIIDWILKHGGTARFTCEDWAGPCGGPDRDHYLAIDTLEGTMKAHAGWVVIKGVAGEFYACEPNIFDKTYIITAPDHVMEWNRDKKHRCPNCHVITDPDRIAQQQIVTCCQCGARFTKNPRGMARKREAGVVCPEHQGAS